MGDGSLGILAGATAERAGATRDNERAAAAATAAAAAAAEAGGGFLGMFRL